jgi:hypothetical protein
MSLTFVQGNTGPDITAVIHREDDPSVVEDLTDATVRFQMRLPEGKTMKVNAQGAITDAVNGKVSYSWGANDLAQHGTFQAQWEVTYPGGKEQTTSPIVEIEVRRK